MNKIYIGLILLVLFGCERSSENGVDGDLITESDAQWIRDGRELPEKSVKRLYRPDSFDY